MSNLIITDNGCFVASDLGEGDYLFRPQGVPFGPIPADFLSVSDIPGLSFERAIECVEYALGASLCVDDDGNEYRPEGWEVVAYIAEECMREGIPGEDLTAVS